VAPAHSAVGGHAIEFRCDLFGRTQERGGQVGYGCPLTGRSARPELAASLGHLSAKRLLSGAPDWKMIDWGVGEE
jgi:hypothetical protein